MEPLRETALARPGRKLEKNNTHTFIYNNKEYIICVERAKEAQPFKRSVVCANGVAIRVL